MIWPRTNYYIVYRPYRVFSLTWPASMQIYYNKRKRLHKERVQLSQGPFGKPAWPPFHCFGTPIWPPCDNTLYSLFETQFWTDKFFTSATRLYGIVQILLQIALLFTAQKLARFREFRINERLIRETFCPFKICPNPRKRGLGNWVWCRSFILIYCG